MKMTAGRDYREPCGRCEVKCQRLCSHLVKMHQGRKKTNHAKLLGQLFVKVTHEDFFLFFKETVEHFGVTQEGQNALTVLIYFFKSKCKIYKTLNELFH